MVPIRKALSSSVGKKYLMAISGVALMGFIVVHLVGNLSLYAGPAAFNGYAAKLAGLGPLLYVAEAGLIFLVLIHFFTAITLQGEKSKASNTKYAVAVKSKGGNSHMNFASRSMIVSGAVIFLFIIYHVASFKYGLFDSPAVYEAVENATPVDLYARVQAAFRPDQPHPYIYIAVMLFLGAHLSHGAWSWIQSLGAMRPDWSKQLYAASIFTGIILAVGFLLIPVYFVITGGVQ